MNLSSITSCSPRIFLVLAALTATSVGWSQSPKYRPPPPPTKGATLELRMRYLIAPDIGFSGFGSVPLQTGIETSNNLIGDTTRSIVYDDGFLQQDYTRATLIEGGLPNQQVVPSENTAATSYFSYSDASQVSADQTELTFHRYFSEANPDTELVGSSSGSLGWELNYLKTINRKRNLALLVGFSFNGFDSRFNGDVTADLGELEFVHEMADGYTAPGLIEGEPDGDGNATVEPFVGDQVHPDDGPSELLNWFVSDESETVIADGATVNSRADFRSSVYNFRAGPTYSMAMGQHFGLQLGAGLSAVYFTGRFSAYEVLMNPGVGTNPSRALTTTVDSEWQVGGYVDASAYYNLTDRVSLFSGMQFQSGSTYNQENDDRHASVDFNSQVYVHAGLGIKF